MDCKYDELSRAQSVDDVVRVTRDYLQTWTAQDIARLPDTCRPGPVGGPQDIELWADRLARESQKALLFLVEDERKLDRLTNHFLIASVRLRQLGD